MMKPLFRLRSGAGLILASESPRRRKLLSSLGIPFQSCSPGAVEVAPEQGEEPAVYARRMATLKGLSLANADGIVIAADTVVSLDGIIFGKPKDEADAIAMLERLNGRRHEVCTAVYIRLPKAVIFHEITDVLFGRFSMDLLTRYVESGEPLDKAGAYAIQGRGTVLVERIAGSHSNVIGLPLEQLVRELLRAGILL